MHRHPRSWFAGRIASAAAVLLVCSWSAFGTPQGGRRFRERPARADRYGDPLPPGAINRLGTVRLRHGDWSAYVAFQPDGKGLVSAGNQAVHVWDVSRGVQLRKIKTGQQQVVGFALSPDGRLAALAGYQSVSVWDLTAAKEVSSVAYSDGYYGWPVPVAISADGKTVAVRCGQQFTPPGKWDYPIRLWHVGQTGEPLALAGHEQMVTGLAFLPDRRTLVSVGHEHTLRFWDAANGRQARSVKLDGNNQITALAVSPDGKTVALGTGQWVPPRGWEGSVRLIDAASGKQLRSLPGHRNQVMCLTFSPDGARLASANYAGLCWWDSATGKLLHRLSRRAGGVAISPDGKTLAFTSNQAIHLWDAAAWKEVSPRPGHDGAADSVAFSPDGRLIASASSTDETVRLWDSADGREIHVLRGHQSSVRAALFTPDGKTLVTGGADNTVRLWDVATGKERKKISVAAEHDPDRGVWGKQVMALALSADGRTILVS